MNYIELIKYLLTTSVLTGGMIYLGKLFIDKFAESRIEKYKNFLEKENEHFKHGLNIEVQKFRHNLNTASTEHQIKYSKLYEERGGVIKSIYILLVNLERSLTSLTTIAQGPEWTTDDGREDKAKESLNILRDFLEQNLIFFSEGLCKKVQSVLLDSHKIIFEMYIAKRNQLRNDKYNQRGIQLTKEELLKPSDTWHELEEKVQNEIKAARLDLADEFRVLIGVT